MFIELTGSTDVELAQYKANFEKSQLFADTVMQVHSYY